MAACASGKNISASSDRPLGRGATGAGAARAARLTSDPLPGLVRSIAVPAGVGLLFQTLFNIVDSFWAGFISTAALTALGASFPVFFLVIVLSVGIGAAATALIANRLGREDVEGGRRLLGQAVFLACVGGLIAALYGIFAIQPLLRFLGTSGDSLEAGVDYLQPIMLFAVVLVLNQTLNSWLTAQGDSRSFRNALILGCALNFALDPLFMFGAFGVPGLGVLGIAIATVLVQALQLVYLVHRARRSPLGLRLRLADIRPNLPILRDFLRQAVPVTITSGATGFGLFCITWFMGRHGEAAIAAYGIGLRIEQLAMLPMIGLNTAAMTLVGQNHGADRPDRVRETARLVMLYGIAVMTLGAIAVWPTRELLIGIFSDDPDLIRLGSAYLGFAVFNFNAYAILILGGGILQGMRRPIFAMSVALFRHVFGPLVVLYLLDPVLGFGLPGIYWGIVTIAWIGAAVTVVYLRRQLPPAELA